MMTQDASQHAEILEAANQITREVFAATGVPLASDDPAVAFGVISQIAVREISKTLNETLAAQLEAERMERQLLKVQVHELTKVVKQLNDRIEDLVRDDPDHPGAIMRLKTIALSMIKVIRG